MRCAICSGPLDLRLPGLGGAPSPAALSPSLHEPGAHGDLYACAECGTVQQPSLPRGRALHDLYRAMADDAYLAETPGRRRTAERLLDLIGAHVPRGRLLDVGCGPGLLLDEARRRGYDVVGLELSATAAAHARDVLGLPVREMPLEHLTEEEFDVIVLADVLEHLDDPLAALDGCHEL